MAAKGEKQLFLKTVIIYLFDFIQPLLLFINYPNTKNPEADDTFIQLKKKPMKPF